MRRETHFLYDIVVHTLHFRGPVMMRFTGSRLFLPTEMSKVPPASVMMSRVPPANVICPRFVVAPLLPKVSKFDA